MSPLMGSCFRKFLTKLVVWAVCSIAVIGFVIVGMNIYEERQLAGLCERRYPLLNPALRCSQNQAESRVFVPEYEQFQSELETRINDVKKQGSITEIGVYFRDLENGPWFGINERQGFFAASLFKLPVMIAVYRKALKSSGILSEEFALTSPPDPSRVNVTDPSETVVQGQYYDVRSLLKRMIVYSDNLSMDILHVRLQQDYKDGTDPEQNIYRDIGVLSTETGGQITPKAYSALLRILYNARYLGKEYSEEALDLLSQADYKKGLAAGVPAGIPIAHKFGIRDSDKPEKFFHDCGIVYHPERPYVLCIMTIGSVVEENESLISDISARVFREVDRRAQKSADQNPLF